MFSSSSPPNPCHSVIGKSHTLGLDSSRSDSEAKTRNVPSFLERGPQGTLVGWGAGREALNGLSKRAAPAGNGSLILWQSWGAVRKTPLPLPCSGPWGAGAPIHQLLIVTG